MKYMKQADVITFLICGSVMGLTAMLATLLFVFLKLTGEIDSPWIFGFIPALCYEVFRPHAHVAVNPREDEEN